MRAQVAKMREAIGRFKRDKDRPENKAEKAATDSVTPAVRTEWVITGAQR